MTQENESQRHALILVTAVVALVVAGVLGLGVAKARHATPAAARLAQATAPTTLKLYFDTGSAQLPPDAQPLLDQAAERARASMAAVVTVSGFVDASGDPQANAELARQRADAVRHALEANGVPPHAIQLSKPQNIVGGSNPREARRVDLTVR